MTTNQEDGASQEPAEPEDAVKQYSRRGLLSRLFSRNSDGADNEPSKEAHVTNDPEDDSLLYNVYFGTNPAPELVISDYCSTWYVLESLNNDQTYYWKIVVKDGNENVIEGPV